MTGSRRLENCLAAAAAVLLGWAFVRPANADDGHETPKYQWTLVTDAAAFPPRDGAGALMHEGAMWLLGGWNPADRATNPNVAGTNNEVWKSVDGAAWKKIKPNTHLDASFDPASDWEARHTAGYVVHQGKMWIIGGDSNLGHYQSDVWNSADGETWHEVPETPWKERHTASVFVFRDALWMVAGNNMERDVWRLDRVR